MTNSTSGCELQKTRIKGESVPHVIECWIQHRNSNNSITPVRAYQNNVQHGSMWTTLMLSRSTVGGILNSNMYGWRVRNITSAYVQHNRRLWNKLKSRSRTFRAAAVFVREATDKLLWRDILRRSIYQGTIGQKKVTQKGPRRIGMAHRVDFTRRINNLSVSKFFHFSRF